MAKQYKWQAYYEGVGPLDAGPMPGQDQSEHITSDTSGFSTTEYYFVDSNPRSSSPEGWWRSNYSKVIFRTNTTWIANIDDHNYLHVTVTVKIANISRIEVVGNPTLYDSSGRNMNAYRFVGDQSRWHVDHDPINTVHAIDVPSWPISLGTWTIDLAPGGTHSQETMYFLNKNDSYETSGDHLHLGVKFTNILPPDYRPGAILDGSSVWQSHNRTGGESHILTGNGYWNEMRTIAGLTEAGNPPSIYINDKWMNQREIGKE